jgi:hypothetical protein
MPIFRCEFSILESLNLIPVIPNVDQALLRVLLATQQI